MRSDPLNRSLRRNGVSADIFAAPQLADMLIALLAVSAIRGLVSLVANLALDRPAAAGVEAALLAGKLGCIAWARRSRGLSIARRPRDRGLLLDRERLGRSRRFARATS